MANRSWLHMVGVNPAVWSYAIVLNKQTAGRGHKCAIHLADLSVSRDHAELARAGDRLSIRDLQSLNGTFVNGIKVIEEAPLITGDRIRMGRVTLEVVASPADPDEDTTSPPQSLRKASRVIPRTALASSSINSRLSPAQCRIVNLLLQGFGEKEIANQLHLSNHTVHTHTKTIYRNLGVHSRGELMAKLLLPEQRLRPPEEVG
jgi:DNA-binding CsgD family transcriptional regulator